MAGPQGVHSYRLRSPGEAQGPLQAKGGNCWLGLNARTPGHYLAGGSLLCAAVLRDCLFLQGSYGRSRISERVAASARVLGGVGWRPFCKRVASPQSIFVFLVLSTPGAVSK